MKTRKCYSIEEKVRIVVLGLSREKSISSICEDHGISPAMYYSWKKYFFSDFENIISSKHKEKITLSKLEREISRLETEKKFILQYIKNHNSIRKYQRLSCDEKNKIIKLIGESGIPLKKSLIWLNITKSSYYKWLNNPKSSNSLNKVELKSESVSNKEAVFSVLHTPPKVYNINRTTWIMSDLKRVLNDKGVNIGFHNIRAIIKKGGYRYLKARKVLTSTDPEYKEKLEMITDTLSNLKENEKFFSIDEYGPFAVKIKGGRSLVPAGQFKTYPQFQKSKGCLILTGALELSTNQFTHFYSTKKNTAEMIKLLELLISKYRDQERLFLSWDAASWHMSKELNKKVDEINISENIPQIKLMPLPACAQFLNVIESVFSGMARAIIHNSNYDSALDCMDAIDLYFKLRNEFYQENPKRAGNKLWGKERIEPIFKESNNCKDPKYIYNF